MGSCLGHCFHSQSRRSDKCYSSYRCNKPEYTQFGDMQYNVKNNDGCLHIPSSLSSFLSIKRKKEPQPEVSLELIDCSWSFQCCDGYAAQASLPLCHHLEPQRRQADHDFHTLDAKALLAPQGTLLAPQGTSLFITNENKSLHSTPPSSIDLEWEHEALFNQRTRRDEEEDSDSAGIPQNNNVWSCPHYKSILSHRARIGSRSASVTLDTSAGSKDGSRMTTPDSLEWDFVDSSIPSIDQETEQLIAEIERLAANALQETGNYSAHANEDMLLSS